MTIISADYWIRRLHRADTGICLLANRCCYYRGVARFFSIVSRLGDGVFWYSLILALPLIFGQRGLHVSLQLTTAGIVGVVVYKLIKQYTARLRPCQVHGEILRPTEPLDYYSFPSGHTLHAITFTIIMTYYFPGLGIICIPFASSVALSRVVLGLHYPTDVIVGGLIGTSIAGITIQTAQLV